MSRLQLINSNNLYLNSVEILIRPVVVGEPISTEGVLTVGGPVSVEEYGLCSLC